MARVSWEGRREGRKERKKNREEFLAIGEWIGTVLEKGRMVKRTSSG